MLDAYRRYRHLLSLLATFIRTNMQHCAGRRFGWILVIHYAAKLHINVVDTLWWGWVIF
jgi:hypothetical protein